MATRHLAGKNSPRTQPQDKSDRNEYQGCGNRGQPGIHPDPADRGDETGFDCLRVTPGLEFLQREGLHGLHGVEGFTGQSAGVRYPVL